MAIEKILGNTQEVSVGNREIDYLSIEWYEAGKKIMRKKTNAGVELALRFLKEGRRLHEGDILFLDDTKMIVVAIKPCEAIKVVPDNLLRMGTVCYEIGNKHLPLFIQEDAVLVPYEDPIFRWLNAMDYKPEKVVTQLTNLLNSTVRPHSHGDQMGGSIFSKIMSLAGK